jgi:hypothetical protein
MEQSGLHSARTLSPPVRVALEQILGRALADNESVSLRVYQPHEAPSPERRQQLAGELLEHFARVDERAKDIPEAEQDEVLDEAIRSVKPGYRSIR